MADSDIAEYLAEHPRMIGVLFAIFMLLTQVGSVAAGGGTGYTGP